MNFTPRKGGPMVTLRTRHDLRPAHFAKILARYGDRMPGGDPRPDQWDPQATPASGGLPSRAAAEGLIRAMIGEFGDGAYRSEAGWDEDLHEGEAALLATWAVAQVHRLYPEAAAADTELAGFARDHAWAPDGQDEEETAEVAP